MIVSSAGIAASLSATLDLMAKTKPNNERVMTGIKATSATMPNASVYTLPPMASLAPMAKESINVAASGPEATAPVSNAIEVIRWGIKNDRIWAMVYPGIIK